MSFVCVRVRVICVREWCAFVCISDTGCLGCDVCVCEILLIMCDVRVRGTVFVFIQHTDYIQYYYCFCVRCPFVYVCICM